MAARTATKLVAQPDVIIIGSGIIGCSIALSLNRRGLRTLNLDKGAGAGSGSTCFSSGIIRTYYTARESAKFAWEGMHYWEGWAEHVGGTLGGGAAGGRSSSSSSSSRVKEEGWAKEELLQQQQALLAAALDDMGGLARYRTCGAVHPRCDASNAFLDAVIGHCRALDIPCEEWAVERAAGALGWDLQGYHPPVRLEHERFGTPSRPDGVRGAVHFPRTGYVSDPLLACRNLEAACAATGLASFRYGSSDGGGGGGGGGGGHGEVTAIRKDGSGGRVVGVRTAAGEELRAPVVVNAAGPHSCQITALAFAPDVDVNGGDRAVRPNDMRVSTRAMRQEVAYVPSPAGVDQEADGVVTADFDLGVYWRPEVGGTMLVGGMEPACDVAEWVEDPDALDSAALSEDWTNIVYRAALRMPGMAIPNSSSGAGIVALYDVTEDFIPVYDRGALDGYYMAIGTSGNQFKNAPAAGELMAEIITQCEGGRDVDADPLQHELKLTGHVLDASLFSRLRAQDGSLTSGTVVG